MSRFYELRVLHPIYSFRKWQFEVLVLTVFFGGCATGPVGQTDQFDRAAGISHSLDSSAAAAEYGSRR
jgi:hypothetical protein